MIRVNTTELNSEIAQLLKNIKKYETLKLNIYNEFKDVGVNWFDGNSKVYQQKIKLEETETRLLIGYLNDELDVLQYIYDKYAELGKKIQCELKFKLSMIKKIEAVALSVQTIEGNFNSVDKSFAYPEQGSINAETQAIGKVKERLQQLAIATGKILDKIEAFEKEIKSKMRKLENVKINEFDYNLV